MLGWKVSQSTVVISLLNIPLFVMALHGASLQSCLQIEKPRQGEVISNSPCTLSIKSCPDIHSVVFKLRYCSEDGLTQNLLTIGNITRPPFSSVCDVSSIPNQIYSGATFIVEAILKDGGEFVGQRGGIFLAHQPILRPTYTIPYSSKRTVLLTREAMRLTSSQTTASGKVYLSWNETTLFFHVEVMDKFFYEDLPKKKFAKLRVDIMIDPEESRKPFPSPSSSMFVIPLMGQPFRLFSKPDYKSDGSFGINEYTQDYSGRCSIRKDDFKGYTIDFPLPWSDVFIKGKPTQFGCNISARALDEKNEVRTLSWVVNANAQVVATPLYWGTVYCAPRPFFSFSVLLWLICFAGGALLGMAGALLIIWSRFRPSVRALGRGKKTVRECPRPD
jgi:hypothetical protein